MPGGDETGRFLGRHAAFTEPQKEEHHVTRPYRNRQTGKRVQHRERRHPQREKQRRFSRNSWSAHRRRDCHSGSRYGVVVQGFVFEKVNRGNQRAKREGESPPFFVCSFACSPAKVLERTSPATSALALLGPAKHFRLYLCFRYNLLR